LPGYAFTLLLVPTRLHCRVVVTFTRLRSLRLRYHPTHTFIWTVRSSLVVGSRLHGSYRCAYGYFIRLRHTHCGCLVTPYGLLPLVYVILRLHFDTHTFTHTRHTFFGWFTWLLTRYHALRSGSGLRLRYGLQDTHTRLVLHTRVFALHVYVTAYAVGSGSPFGYRLRMPLRSGCYHVYHCTITHYATVAVAVFPRAFMRYRFWLLPVRSPHLRLRTLRLHTVTLPVGCTPFTLHTTALLRLLVYVLPFCGSTTFTHFITLVFGYTFLDLVTHVCTRTRCVCFAFTFTVAFTHTRLDCVLRTAHFVRLTVYSRYEHLLVCHTVVYDAWLPLLYRFTYSTTFTYTGYIYVPPVRLVQPQVYRCSPFDAFTRSLRY